MKFKGIIPAIITPFNEDGSIFEEGLRNEIDYLYKCDFRNILYVSGTADKNIKARLNIHPVSTICCYDLSTYLCSRKNQIIL